MGVHAVMSKRELTPDRLFEAITDAQSEASRGAHELLGGARAAMLKSSHGPAMAPVTDWAR
jgi:hypothetical protein